MAEVDIESNEMHDTRTLAMGEAEDGDDPEGRYGSPGVFNGKRKERAAFNERWKYGTAAG